MSVDTRPAEVWTPRVTYDDRVGTMAIQLVGPNGEAGNWFHVRVQDLLRNLDIPPHAMRYYLSEAKEDYEPLEQIEVIRQRTVVETDLAGKIVLDVGGYMGEFAKLALDHGAKRATVLDNEQWRHYGWPEKRLEGVEYVQGSLTDYLPLRDGSLEGPANYLPRPDCIILYNILYHLKNPWRYLDRCREVIADDGTMLVCTLFRFHLGRWCYWYEERECNPSDETVYNGPTLDTLELWFRRTGWTYERTGKAYDRVCYRLKPIPGFRRTHEDD